MSSGLPALVKAGTISKAVSIFGLTHTVHAATSSLTSDAAGVRMLALEIVRLSAKAEDTGSQIKANSRVLLRTGPFNPPRYTFMVAFNPELLKTGAVSCPAFYSHKDLARDGITLGLQASAALDLESLDWVFELRAID